MNEDSLIEDLYELREERDHYKALADDLRSALIEAKKTIRQWHGMGMPDDIEPRIWGIYESQAPEMKSINKAIGG